MRLRSKHARRGHSPACRCPEEWERLVGRLRQWQREHITVLHRAV